MGYFEFLDYLGTGVFAISGALVAMRRRLDPFGVFIIGFVTAVGGGTIRDILLGNTPVTWMKHTEYVSISIFSVILAILFRNHLKYISRSLSLFDTIGIGIFTIIGTKIGIDYHLSGIICVALGTITATFGGVVRDILCSRVPIIFKKEIYATACIFGGIVFVLLYRMGVSTNFLYIFTILTVVVIRLIAVKYKLSIPPFSQKE
ncbi:MAG: trimeric intracellular cation channel family protein [Flavobacteriaceae bacterium]|nr:trimeric intracellular cation channel family protein [Flavobacteriaceae bacterium]